MAEKCGESRSKQAEEQMQRRATTLEFDEVLLLRSIQGKLDAIRMGPREHMAASVGGLIC